MASRVLPSTDGLLLAFLRPVLTDVQVVSRYPAPRLRQFPIALIRRVPGGGAVHPRFLDSPTAQLDVFAKSATEAEDVAHRVIQTLYEAWDKQTVVDDGTGINGHIGVFDVSDGPAELRDSDQDEDIYHYTATLELLVRP